MAASGALSHSDFSTKNGQSSDWEEHVRWSGSVAQKLANPDLTKYLFNIISQNCVLELVTRSPLMFLDDTLIHHCAILARQPHHSAKH